MYIREAIAIAAEQLSTSGHIQFTSQQLAVAVWELDRAAFGLPGFEQLHPDHHSVSASMHGVYGSIARGVIARVGANLYEFRAPYVANQSSAHDRLSAREAMMRNERSAKERHGSTVVEMLTETQAFILWQSGQKNDITWQMAERFWGIDVTEQGIERLTVVLRDTNGPAARNMLHLHDWLQDRFIGRLRDLGAAAKDDDRGKHPASRRRKAGTPSGKSLHRFVASGEPGKAVPA